MTDFAPTILLVGTIEKYPVLYDHMGSDYMERNAQDKAWGKISKEVNISGLLQEIGTLVQSEVLPKIFHAPNILIYLLLSIELLPNSHQ
ncbi:hypothetical protein JTB14_010453 [Gonioctena quinquepunctata]|nr:hypothetical protein JTB14_010453 [Gonioctena quinquepunctata]